jgi:hypothetical protein
MQNLSHLVDQDTALTAGQSQSAGNTINHPVTTVGPAPGSNPVNSPPAVKDLDDTGLDIDPPQNYTHLVS